MPTLKGKNRKGIENINEVMALRENKQPFHEPEAAAEEKEAVAAVLDENPSIKINSNTNNMIEAKKSSLYEKHRSSNGKVLRRKYDAGKPPRAHLELYTELVAGLEGKKRGIVLLKPILEKLEMSYATSAKIFSLLEEYGYLYFERAKNEQGRLLIIEILKAI